MKNVFKTVTLLLISNVVFSQNPEIIHQGMVIGSFEFGNKEVTTIYDEVTGCERKTSPHSKNLFIPNESVQIKISENKQMAEVIKPALPEQVYTNKNCGNERQNCISSLCVLNNNENNLIIRYTWNNYKVYYNASKRPNNSIKSSLIIYGGNNGNGAIPISHFLDKTNLNTYKLTSYKNVIEESNKLSKRANIQISNAEETLIEKFLLDIKTNEPLLTKSELAKSIFYHFAILKTTKRVLESNSSECNCAPVPLYFTDKSPFLCQEDLSYNINELLNNLEGNFSVISNQYSPETINQVKTYLESKLSEGNIISFENTYIDLSNGVPSNLFNSSIEDYIETSWCPDGLGSDLGCCGNYSGCCWYSSAACLIHDVICIGCHEWHCGFCH
jgi:hypothetical protein